MMHARYFFHVVNGDGRSQDHEGAELPSPDEARAHAVDGVRSMLAEDVRVGTLDLAGRIEVTDERGAQLFDVRYCDAVSIVGAGTEPADHDRATPAKAQRA
jgi:hypothetical protein